MDVIISTRVIVLFIAVRVKYGISQSPGIVVFVLAPCHSRNMPQCVEIFEGKRDNFEIRNLFCGNVNDTFHF